MHAWYVNSCNHARNLCRPIKWLFLMKLLKWEIHISNIAILDFFSSIFIFAIVTPYASFLPFTFFKYIKTNCTWKKCILYMVFENTCGTFSFDQSTASAFRGNWLSYQHMICIRIVMKDFTAVDIHFSHIPDENIRSCCVYRIHTKNIK